MKEAAFSVEDLALLLHEYFRGKKDVAPSAEELANKPFIKVSRFDVDFGKLRFHVEQYSDYQSTDIELIDSENMTREDIALERKRGMFWLDRVLNYRLGSWGGATFKQEGLQYIDEWSPEARTENFRII